MGNRIRSVVVAASAVCVLALPIAGRSQGYFNADIGVAVPEKVDVKGVVGVSTPGVKLDLDPGIRFGVSGGFNFTPFLGVEMETGFIHNNVNAAVGPGGVVGTDASISHVPLLVNVVFRYDQPNSPWVPYAGIGAGGDVSILWDNVVDDSDSTIEFAWQGFGGFRYKLNESMSIGAAYKYYSVQNASWDLGGFADYLQIGKANIHSFMVEFNWKF